MTPRPGLALPLVAPAYVGAVTGGALAARALLDPGRRRRLVLACSTNPDNLAAGRLSVLLTSLVVVEEPPDAAHVLTLLGVLGAGEALWGPGRLAAVAVGGHVGASLAVDAGLRVALARGAADPALRSAPDVGTSYAALAVAGALAAALPGRALLLVGLAALVGPPLRGGVSPTDAGHALSAALGALAGALLLRAPTGRPLSARRPRAPARRWAPPGGRAGRPRSGRRPG